MTEKCADTKIGGYAFLGGIALAVLVALGQIPQATATPILLVLGVVVGFLNITPDESQRFLLATIALVVTGSSLGMLPVKVMGRFLQAIVVNIMVFTAPAAAVVAVKTIYDTAAKK